MAFVNETGLATVRDWVKSLINAANIRIDNLAAEGGEPNVIESVKVNGTALAVTDKAVDVTVPTTVAALSDASDYATTTYVDQNGGKIDTISVNGTAQTITNKNVNITVPTRVDDLDDSGDYALDADIPTVTSDLINDSGYQTASDVSSAIATAVSSVYRYKGSVATKTALPNDATEGDVYDVQSTGMNYAWNGSKWDELGMEFDGSLFWAKSELEAMTVAEVTAILEA